LELAYPLSRDLELLVQLGEGGGLPVVEAVAPDQDVPMALGKPLYSLLEGGCFPPDTTASAIRCNTGQSGAQETV